MVLCVNSTNVGVLISVITTAESSDKVILLCIKPLNCHVCSFQLMNRDKMPVIGIYRGKAPAFYLSSYSLLELDRSDYS